MTFCHESHDSKVTTFMRICNHDPWHFFVKVCTSKKLKNCEKACKALLIFIINYGNLHCNEKKYYLKKHIFYGKKNPIGQVVNGKLF